MSVFDFFRKKHEVRADEPSPASEPTTSLLALFGISGEITRDAALSIPTVAACINKIGDTISRLPVKLYRKSDDEVIEITDDKRLELLNGDTGDTLSTVDMWKAAVEDYFLGGGAWIFTNYGKSLHYIDSRNISINSNTDPVFKAFNVLVNGISYYDFQFIKLFRKTKDGFSNIPLQQESSQALSAAWNALKLENMMNANGGCKPGFLHAETRLAKDALEEIREGYSRIYDNDENRRKLIVLNNGIKFEPIASTAAELQLNENKKTNSIEVCKLFGFPHTVIDGGASDDDNKKFISAVISIINQIETELDRVLLLESEKKNGLYWAFDVKELTRGSLKERYDAYEIAVRNNILQIDEIRREEDYAPLGFNFVKLGLSDVLLNPDTMEVFTPNTGQTKNLRTGEIRARGDGWTKGEKGLFTGSTGSGSGGSSGGGKKVDKSGESGIIDNENAKKELEKAIADGKVKTKLDRDSQLKHKFGSAEYKKRIADGELPSYFDKSNMELQSVINSAGTSGVIYKTSKGQFKQVITLESAYGMFGDRNTRTYIPTDRATIHYSKKGTHIVPAPPKGEQK